MSLKSKVESAVLALLQTDPLLQACHPKPSITTEDKPDFPTLTVTAQRPGKMYPEVEIYKVPVQIILETEFDDASNDALLTAIETFTAEHAMIEPINAMSNTGLYVFDNIGENDTENINPNFRTQTVPFTLVCCETATQS